MKQEEEDRDRDDHEWKIALWGVLTDKMPQYYVVARDPVEVDVRRLIYFI